jgi:hypothetical protein
MTVTFVLVSRLMGSIRNSEQAVVSTIDPRKGLSQVGDLAPHSALVEVFSMSDRCFGRQM